MVAADTFWGRVRVSTRRRSARGVRRLRHGRPRLSVVVLAGPGDPARLHATLSSVRDQPSPAIEIVVVGYAGSRDAADMAGADTRARFLTAPSRPAALALGVSRSRGEFVVVASPGDVYLPGALADLLGSLIRGRIVLLSDAPTDGSPADLESSPEVARSPTLGRLVVPKDQLAAAVSAADVEGMLGALTLLRRGFTPTGVPAYVHARTVKPGPFTVRTNPFPGLAAHLDRDQSTLAALSDLPEARRQRAIGALVGLAPYLESVELASPEDWERLCAHAQSMREMARGSLADTEVVARVLALLAAEDRRDEVVELVAARRFAGDDFPTEVRHGRVFADLKVDLPEEALELGPTQTPLRSQARRLFVEGGDLCVESFVGVRHVSPSAMPTLTARLVSGERALSARVEVRSDPAVNRWMGESEHDHDAGLVILRLSLNDLAPGRHHLELAHEADGVRRLGRLDDLWAQGSAGRSTMRAGEYGVRLVRSEGSIALEVGEPPSERTGSFICDASVSDEAVLVDGPGAEPLPLEHDPWGLGPQPLPTGNHRISGVLSDELIDRLPEEVTTSHHRVTLGRLDDGLSVRLEPLLADDERGPRAQRLLQERFKVGATALKPQLVYFQSFTGQWANDHPLAIQEELHRRDPGLDVRWLVADSSARVPPGTRPVLFRSREWYDVLGSAAYLVTNIELERWFTRRPGQQILQTFHGYPSKAMGLGLWRARGLPPSHLKQQLDHTSGVWNNLLTPDPAMDRHYREQYAYDGKILALGYPRDDVLVGPGRDAQRERVRSRLGIRPGQRAVLYAPTWRDDLATNFRAAETVDHLDVPKAADALGANYVWLLRGHRFHRREQKPGRGMIDVTTYPDVNDLILAADAAVFDYTSMRFDFALTGRPMIFLVPDLDDYASQTRGFLWDFRESAPGPLVADTAEVIRELRDLPGLSERWAEPIVSFNARYNTLQDGHAAERVVSEFFADLLD